MSIASKSDHNQMVHGVKSKIRKKTAGNSSPCPKYARADFQNPSEDQAILMGPDQTIGGIYHRLSRKCSGGKVDTRALCINRRRSTAANLKRALQSTRGC